MRKLLIMIFTTMLLASTQSGSQAASTKAWTVKIVAKGATGKTALLIAKSGRVLSSKKITSNSQAISFVTPRLSTINGSSIQLVKTSGGQYFGPVVLGWASSTSVYSAIKTTSTTTNYGDVTLKASTGGQGYAKASSKSSKVDTSRPSKATSYKPIGVGTYGKATGGSRHTLVGPSSHNFKANGNGSYAAATGTDTLDGADSDGDGLPNAFDVNDDGDAVVDSADRSTPTPSVGSSCEANASFRIFTNFKSTQTNFENNINVYASGVFEATTERIGQRMTDSLVMVLQPIQTVCGQNVTKTEIKGIGLSYAPTEYVDITSTLDGHFDYQWNIGRGEINGSPVLPDATLTPSNISGQDVLVQRVTTASGVYEFASTPGFIFVTHPVPFEYQVTAAGVDPVDGNWNTVTFGDNGRATYSIQATNANSQINLKVYRPQRLAIGGETGSFFDLGGFVWTPQFPNVPAVGNCDELRAIDTQMTTDQAVNTSTKPYLILKWNLHTCNGFESSIAGASDFDVMVESPGPGGNSAQKLALSVS